MGDTPRCSRSCLPGRWDEGLTLVVLIATVTVVNLDFTSLKCLCSTCLNIKGKKLKRPGEIPDAIALSNRNLYGVFQGTFKSVTMPKTVCKFFSVCFIKRKALSYLCRVLYNEHHLSYQYHLGPSNKSHIRRFHPIPMNNNDFLNIYSRQIVLIAIFYVLLWENKNVHRLYCFQNDS